MAGVRLTIDARSLKEHMQAAAKATRNLRPAMRDIGEHMLRSVQRNFDAEGRPVRWQPLAASTLMRKVGGKRRSTKKRGGLRSAAARRLRGNKILTATGRLRRSISYRASARQVLIGTNVIYAATHQFGRGRIPARPFLLVQDEDKQKARSILLEHVAGNFR